MGVGRRSRHTTEAQREKCPVKPILTILGKEIISHATAKSEPRDANLRCSVTRQDCQSAPFLRVMVLEVERRFGRSWFVGRCPCNSNRGN
jgi:hypothetical protein